MKQPIVALLSTFSAAGFLLLLLLAACSPPAQSPSTETTPSAATVSTALAKTPSATNTPRPTFTASTTSTPAPTATRSIRAWQWVEPGFAGPRAITLTQGIPEYLYYDWSPRCDTPARKQIPMIWGKKNFYTDTVALKRLFDGPCNDGRPLLFLNEPAKKEQADISPIEAAHMFYTMTRGTSWPFERWHGPIYAGNNLVEDSQWDKEFVRQFATLHNGGSPHIPEIAGWAVHLYGNYEYGPNAGDPNTVWTEDIAAADVPGVVDRSMRKLNDYLAERKAEDNSTALLVTEFGLLQASNWHTPRTHHYATTTRFMDEYVRAFDQQPKIQAWFWFISASKGEELFLDTDLMVDGKGALTPNGLMWRELAQGHQKND